MNRDEVALQKEIEKLDATFEAFQTILKRLHKLCINKNLKGSLDSVSADVKEYVDRRKQLYERCSNGLAR